MVNCVWISEDIFYSYAAVGISKIIEDIKWQRSYEIWEHAYKLMDNYQDEFSLADGIANLKRSLNNRLQLIEEIYNFKKIRFKGKPNGYLELLETYGLVRPFIMKELLKIRNGIEHHDQKPPDIARCKEFLDVVWYFLKSTDNIVQIVKHHIDFNIRDENGNETMYRYVIEIDWNNHYNLIIRGYFPKEYIINHKNKKFIEVQKVEGEELYEFIDDNLIKIYGKCSLSADDYHILLKEIFMYAK